LIHTTDNIIEYLVKDKPNTGIAALIKNLTLKFLRFLHRFSGFRVTAEDLFRAYILSIAGAAGFTFEQIAQLAT